MRANRTTFRTETGLYLVECLVGLILGALLCFTLLQMLAQTMRVTSTNANQQNAALIAQTVLDSVKARNFNELVPGTYILKVNSSNPGETSDDLPGHLLPAGLNIGWLTWKDKSKGSKFPGTVTLTIQEGVADPTTLSAVVSVSWSDSQTQLTKTVATTTTLHSKGANFWP